MIRKYFSAVKTFGHKVFISILSYPIYIFMMFKLCLRRNWVSALTCSVLFVCT